MNPKVILGFCRKNLPGILSAAAAGGVALTGWLSLEAGKKIGKDGESPEAFKAKLKKYWKNYIPPVASGLGTIICIFGAHKLHLSKEAAMAAAVAFYKATDSNGKASFDTVARVLTNDAMTGGDLVNESIDAKDIKRPNIPDHGVKIRIWEPYTKQWFEASQQDILWAELVANKMLNQRGTVTLNDVLAMFNCKKKREGDRLGWSWDDEMFNESASYYYSGGWIDICPQWCDENGETRFILDYGINPCDISEFVR